MRTEAFIETSDDFYPSYTLANSDKKFVRLIFMRLSTGDWRTAVWGADDLGYEFDTRNRDHAASLYEQLKREPADKVTKRRLEQLGFSRA